MRLTVTNLTNSSISVGGRVGKLPAGISSTTTLELTVDELEKVQSRLVALKTAGVILFTVAANTNTDDDAAEGVTVQYMEDYVTTALAGVSGGGGGGMTYVVGNSVAGDTSSNCTHLDSGNGDALRTALAAAAGTGGMVFVRRGTYTIGGATGLTTIPAGVTLMGEGYNTILALPREGQMYSLLLSGNSRLFNIAVRHTGLPTGAISDAPNNRFVEMHGSSVARDVYFECRADASSVDNYPGFWSIIRMSQFGARLETCNFLAYSATALGAGSEAIAAMAVGQYNEMINCTFGDPGASNRIDVGAEIGEGSWNRVVGCTIYNSRNYGVRIVGVGGTVERCGVQNSRLVVASGFGVGSLFVGATDMRDIRILGCDIDCAAGATAGIQFAAVNAGENIDGLAIQGCALRGAGAGTGIEITQTGGSVTNVSDSLNRVSNFATPRTNTSTGPTVTTGNY
jgi:hypothetical protein